MYLHSISAIADDIFDSLKEIELQKLRETEPDDVVMFHLSWGMWIRNHYKLWSEDHPLTTNWHKHPDQRKIENGVDMSEDHPDAISMKIMERVHKKANS